jgi:hypothetical protein
MVQVWRSIAVASLLASIGLLGALVKALVFPVRSPRLTDDRLIGTWQSDADRTIAEMREAKPIDAIQEAALRTLFGKMRVTYTETSVTIVLDETAWTLRYEVLGKDKWSVVFRAIDTEPSNLNELLMLSEFNHSRFTGADSYWVFTESLTFREYFKRVG